MTKVEKVMLGAALLAIGGLFLWDLLIFSLRIFG